ncbi:MAG: PhoX family protein [Gammaproteobacteria bacterium]|nr:PhoX family protein [Gammaproteobacteria bacterium]
MINRRRFLQSVAASATLPAMSAGCAVAGASVAELRPDPRRLFDLPLDYEYRVVSRVGTEMSDGLTVPGMHDGMAAFDGGNGRVRLVCNHEIRPEWTYANDLRARWKNLPEDTRALFYDRGEDITPGLGGTTTTIYNTVTRETERQFLSLGGTDTNCAGGPTPWGSWLSCEECFEWPGRVAFLDTPAHREKNHGYVFEVPSAADELTPAQAIKAMGRFVHEACAVDPATGIVYMTEDQHQSLFYRFVPKVPGQLLAGGELQVLAIDGRPMAATHNWAYPEIRLNRPLPVHWLVLDDADPGDDVLRENGVAIGAATFARGEGLTFAGDRLAFTCTIGGPARLGQVFTYLPITAETGQLELIAEAANDSVLKNADNLTMAPWGDLIVCEDTGGNCALVGIRQDGSQYVLANNPYSDSELAGVCFSPDGKTLFVNIQYPGMTLAITGPWPN